MRARHVLVRGRVQGVGFRWFARQEARRLGLAGWVKNLTDGTVELEVGGEASAVGRFLEHIRVGPEAADVIHIVDEEILLLDSLPYPFTVLK